MLAVQCGGPAEKDFVFLFDGLTSSCFFPVIIVMAASSGEEEELLLSLEPQEQQQRHLDDMSLDELMSLNITSDQELDCLFGFLRTPYNLLMDEYLLPGNRFCNSTWDGIICWPTTPAGATAVLPCFDELNGIKYDTDRKFWFLFSLIQSFEVCLSSSSLTVR